MESNATEGAPSNYGAALKTTEATFIFISATASSSTAEAPRSGGGRRGVFCTRKLLFAFHIMAGDAALPFLLMVNVPWMTASAGRERRGLI